MSHPLPSPKPTDPLPHELRRAFDAAVTLTERIEILGPEWEAERRRMIDLKKRLGLALIHHPKFHEEGTIVDDATRSAE